MPTMRSSPFWKTGATIADLEAALIYARGEGNYIDRLGYSLNGKVAQLADINAADDER